MKRGYTEVLVGEFDTGRLTALAVNVRRRGGIASNAVDTAIAGVQKRQVRKVVLYGEMLPYCVRFAVEDLLELRSGDSQNPQIQELQVDLRRCRGLGSPATEQESGGFRPNREQLAARKLALESQLSTKHRIDPRLKFIP